MTASMLRRTMIRLFSENETFWKLAAVVLGLVSFLRGIRLPSRWAATQAMVNYDFGVVKRGLFGATLGRWFHLQQYGRFALASFALLFCLVLLLVAFTLKSKILRRLGAGEPVAVFFASFAITYVAHLVGYLEIPLAILTIVLLMIRSPWGRFAAALPGCIVGLMIHEMFFFVFLPAVLFSFVLDGCLQQDGGRQTRIFALAAGLMLICAGVTFRLGHQSPMSLPQAQAVQRSIAERADFAIRPDFFDVLTFSSSQSFNAMKDHFLHWSGWRQVFVESLLIFAPTALLVFFPGYWVLKAFPERLRRWTVAAAVVAACSPLAMHLFGFDSARWDALVCVETYLVLLTICLKMPGETLPLPAGYRNASILVIALSMATAETLMDGKVPNSFPFRTAGQVVVHSLRLSKWMPPDM